jgi:5-methylcytosine-specific restriction endonuclease McrA
LEIEEQQMAYSDERLNDIFDRTSGYCHICGLKLSFSNYGVFGARGSWEVEHSRPRCEEGSTRLCNLYAAHISCNRSKRARSTRSVRAQYGRTRAPLSVNRRSQAKVDNALGEALVVGLIGALLAGRGGFAAGALLGYKHGYDLNPDH